MPTPDQLDFYLNEQEKQSPNATPNLPIYKKAAELRHAGAGWDQIENAFKAQRQDLINQGATPEQIDKAHGFDITQPGAFAEMIKHDAKQQIQAGDPTSAWGHLWNSVRTSTAGIGTGIAPKTLEEYEAATQPARSRFGRVMQGIGTGIGETPEFLGIEAAASAGGANVIGSTALAFAIPAMQRKAYVMDLQRGRVRNGQEWLQRTVELGQEGLEGAGEGAAMALTGGVGGRIGKMVNPFAESAGTLIGQTAGLATSQALLAGHMPTKQDFIDTSIMVATFHIGGKGLEGGKDWVANNLTQMRDNAEANLQDWYARTGELPKDAWRRALKDPFFMQKLRGIAPVGLGHPLDDHAPTPEGSYVTPYEKHPVTGGAAKGDTFQGAIPFILKFEGRYTVDQGGRTMWGISEKANPEAWRNGPPTLDEAIAIYKHKYWDGMGIDNVPAAMRLNLFDAAVNEGPGKARELLNASGGDPEVFMRLRKQHYDNLIQTGKYSDAQYRSWMGRLRLIEGGEIPPGWTPNIAGMHYERPSEAQNYFTDFNEKPMADREIAFEDQRAALREEDGSLKTDYKELDHALAEAIDQKFNPERADEALKWAMENDRKDISQAIIDKAQTHADKLREEAGPAMPGGETPKLAAFAELQQAADEAEKKAKAMQELAGFPASPRDMRPIPIEPTQTQKDVAHPNVRHALTGNAEIDRVIKSPVTANVIANAKVNKDYATPWTASGSTPLSDPTVYIGNHVPDTLTTKSGKVFRTDIPLVIHENIEQHVMEALIKGGFSKSDAYMVAHWTFAEAAEHAWYRAHGIDPAEAEEAWLPVIEAGLKDTSTDYPPNPYRDTGQFAKDAHSMHDVSEPKPSKELVAKAMEILKPDEQSGAVEFGRKGAGGGSGKVSGQNPMLVPGIDPWGDMLRVIDKRGTPDLSTEQKVHEFLEIAYAENFNRSAPINRMRDARMGRLGQDGVSPAQAVNDPVFLAKLADAAADSHALYMLNNGMIEAVRNPNTGELTFEWKQTDVPSFKDTWGKDSFGSEAEYNRFLSYSVARWMVQEAKLGRPVPGNVESAKLVIAEEHARALNPEPVATLVPRLLDIAKRIKVDVFHHDLRTETSALAQKVRGSAFYAGLKKPTQNKLGEIHIENPDHNFRGKYGEDSPYELVLAHEIGHGVAHHLGGIDLLKKGVPAPRMTLMADQNMIASLRFKPWSWAQAKKGTDVAHSLSYYNQPKEIIADAFGLAMVDPEARPYLTELYKMAPGLEKFAPIYPRLQMGSEVTRRFRDAVDYRNGTLRYARDAGLVSGEDYLHWMASKQAAIPGYRSEQDMAAEAIANGHIVPEAGSRLGRGAAGKLSWNPFMRAKGDDVLRLQRIEKSLVQDTTMRVKLAQNNLRNTAVINMALREGLAEKVRGKPIKFTMDALTKPADPDNNAGAVEDQALWRYIPRKAGADEIPIVRDGNVEIYKMTDAAMIRYLKGYDNMRLSAVQQVLSKATTFYRDAIVNVPTFGPRNFMMDAVWQPLVKDVTVRQHLDVYWKGIPEVLKHFTGKGDDSIYRAFQLSAAGERVFNTVPNDPFVQELMRSGGDPALGTVVPGSQWRPVHMLRTWTRMWMDVPKVGRYAQLIKEGDTALQAGVKAQSYAFHSPSFGGPASQVKNMLTPFWQAHLNGMEQLMRSALGQQAGNIKYVRDFLGIQPGMANIRPDGSLYNAPKFYTHAMMFVTIPFLVNWWMNKDQQWYKDMPDWQKYNGLGFDGFGLFSNHPIYIKYPPLVGYLFGGLPVMALEKAYREHGPGVGDALKGLAGAFMPWAPGLAVAWAQPLVENYLNKSVQWDRPLVSDYNEKNHLPEDQYNPWNSEVSKKVSRLLGTTPIGAIAPPYIDNLIRGWGGPAGQAATALVDQALIAAGAAKPSPLPPDVSHWPIVGSMFVKDAGEFTHPVQMFLDRWHAWDQMHGSLMKAMENNDLPRFEEILQRNPLEAAMHKKRLMEEDKMMMVGVDTRPFQQALMNVTSRIPQQAQMDMNVIMTAHRAIEFSMDRVAAFEAGKDVRLPPEKKSGPLELTGTDRVQLIRNEYRLIQKSTDEALSAMDRNGWK